MQKLTLKSSIARAEELNIPIVGDLKFRGECPLEDSDLASFFAWVRFKYPQYYNLVFHPEMEMPVNGAGSYAYHAKSKAKGRLDGIADVIVLPISKGAPAFMCELKRKNISKSLASKDMKIHFEDQLMILSSQKEHGAIAIVALGLDAIKQSFTEYVKEYK